MCKKNNIIKRLQECPMDYSDLYIMEKHQTMAKRFLKNLRSDFPIIHDKNKMQNHFESSYNFIYAKQIAEYYNNDICITATHLFVSQKNHNLYSRNTIGYFFDGLVQRIFSCWDYIFQSLNIFWDLEFLSSTKEREILAEIYTKKWDFIENGNGIQLVCSEYSEEELKAINQRLKKDLKVLHTDTIKKQIKKDGKFSIIPEFDELMNLYNNSDCTKLKKEYRNSITHSNSSTFKMRIESGDRLLPGKSLCFSNKTCVDDETIALVKSNLQLLQKGIAILLNIIWNNIVPNSKQNENIKYYGVCLNCETCNFEDSMVQEAYELFQKYPHKFLCPNCDKPLTIKEKLNMTERDHTKLLQNIEKAEKQMQFYLQNVSDS